MWKRCYVVIDWRDFMAKQQLINRAKYKDIKRYDHNQMERFARSLYESGFKDGADTGNGNGKIQYETDGF